MASSTSSHLELHFDINKTLIVSDPAAGVSLEDMVNAIISEFAWGTCNDDKRSAENPAGWVCVDGEVHAEAPEGSAQGTTTFADTVEGLERKHRKRLKAHFTKPGHPGQGLAHVRDELLALLTIEEQHRPNLLAALPEIYARNQHYFYILPSFFALIRHLESCKRSYNIIFRSFGIDVPHVAKEWNLFCSGKHPVFPGAPLDGSDGGVDRRIVFPNGTGTFARHGDGVFLGMTSSQTGLVTVAKGQSEIVRLMDQAMDSGHHTLGLVDDFSHWSACGEADDAGKLLALSDAAGVHKVFFDDNVERDRAHIVDVRAANGQPKAFGDTLGCHLVRCLPVSAIRNKNYFIETLAACERAYAARS
eukprot:m.113951 g.113951  ORF g.113951 m.113951 type:complete len:361 (+) comp16274_c0_seq1:93-1175(+)